MAILARTLHVRNFRNYDDYTLELDPGVTVLVGRNAQGKTNLVEALQLATSGASFRKPSPAELVEEGEEGCSIALRLEGDGRVVDLGCTVRDGKRSFSRNGKKCRAAGVRGVVPSVLFCPDDLDMIKRSASVRRAALDGFGVQLNERYAQLLGTYERLVEQRNALLKERWCTREMLAAWNDSLAQAGASLLTHRLALLDRIRVRFVEAYAQIAPGERADITYEASVDAVLGATAGDAVAADAGGLVAAGEDVAADDRSADGTAANRAGVDRTTQVAWWRERMLAALDAVFNDELRRGITLVGPHRDEIRFSIDGRDARAFASQGQQRSLVLAWKVAEVAVTRDILGRPPLLLLDDVMSELDAERREAFVRGIEDEVQTVITTTNLGYFSDAILDRAKVVTIGTV
ncbi:DNA replication and repair protein RecF [Collinsella sp. An307]|uniref:DNA replication/repair protein RecF n=1 Tax=Collinsella sp. An307 TaxID=1965630 RepID=UPI000B38B7D6|nr:DNA replication and repair protein RecF [Collinsella sp. An307]OUO20130.1 DNA replication and repair protein RecF [Collinsella sp. An307]